MVKLWDAGSGAALQTLEGHSGPVTAVASSPDGRVLASGSDDETVKMWDASSRALLQTTDVDYAVYTLSFSDDGSLIQTNKGQLLAIFPSDDAAVSRANLQQSIFVKEQWISLNMANFLWSLRSSAKKCRCSWQYCLFRVRLRPCVIYGTRLLTFPTTPFTTHLHCI
jgi:WD40 repeat protein